MKSPWPFKATHPIARQLYWTEFFLCVDETSLLRLWEAAIHLGSVPGGVCVGRSMPTGSPGTSALPFIQEGKRSGTKAAWTPVAYKCPLLPHSNPWVRREAFGTSPGASKGMMLSKEQKSHDPEEAGIWTGNLVHEVNIWNSELTVKSERHQGEDRNLWIAGEASWCSLITSQPLPLLGSSPHAQVSAKVTSQKPQPSSLDTLLCVPRGFYFFAPGPLYKIIRMSPFTEWSHFLIKLISHSIHSI